MSVVPECYSPEEAIDRFMSQFLRVARPKNQDRFRENILGNEDVLAAISPVYKNISFTFKLLAPSDHDYLSEARIWEWLRTKKPLIINRRLVWKNMVLSKIPVVEETESRGSSNIIFIPSIQKPKL